MNQNRTSLSLLAMVNLAFILGIAFGCKSLKELVQERNRQFLLSADIFIWSEAVLTLITGGGVVWLIWTFMRMPSISKWITGIYLIVGLYIVLSPILLAKSLPMIRWFTFFPPVLGYDSLFYFTGTVVTVLGLIRLITGLRPQKI